MTDLCACLQWDKIISEVVFLLLFGGLLILVRFIYSFSGYVHRNLSLTVTGSQIDSSYHLFFNTELLFKNFFQKVGPIGVRMPL